MHQEVNLSLLWQFDINKMTTLKFHLNLVKNDIIYIIYPTSNIFYSLFMFIVTSLKFIFPTLIVIDYE